MNGLGGHLWAMYVDEWNARISVWHLRRRVYFRALVQQQPHDLDVAVFRRGDSGSSAFLCGQDDC